MSEWFKKVKQEISLEKVIVRLVLSWLLTALVFYIKTGMAFNTPEYTANINMPMYISFVILFFFFFCALAYFKVFSWVETYGPMLLLTLYAFLTVKENNDIAYISGIVILLAVTIIYAVNKTHLFLDIKHKGVVVGIYVIAAVFYAFVTGSVTVFRYLTYRSSTFDMGIWTQMFYYMKNTFEPLTTCERNVLLSHFAVHFSPIYYVFLPFYMIFPSAVTLQILQAITVVSGIIPVYLLCKHFKISKSATVAFGILFVLFPSLACGCYYDLHENCFLTPLILWLFYFIEKDNNKCIILFSILLCLVKEDAPIYLACIGLFIIFGKKKYIKGTVMTLFAIAAFGVITGLINHFGLGIQDYRYSNYSTAQSSGGIIDVVKTFISNPVYAVSECFSKDRIEFLILMFLPLGFLSVASKKISQLLMLIPMVLVNLASDVSYQHSIFFQYTFGTAAILIYLAILNYTELNEKTRRFMCSVALCASVILVPVCSLSRTYYMNMFYYDREIYNILDEAVESIPDDAIVTASTFFVTHLAYRNEIYDFDSSYGTASPIENGSEYVMLDMRWNEVSENEIDYLVRNGFKITDSVDNLYIILKKSK